jgi:hypothetical protein
MTKLLQTLAALYLAHALNLLPHLARLWVMLEQYVDRMF